MNQKHIKIVRIGNIEIGGANKIAIQSMTNTLTKDIKSTIEQINLLEGAGCEIARIAIPDIESAQAISKIKSEINVPLIADIHFDYKLALKSIENGIDKLRLNPGNIGADWKVKEVALAALDKNIPIRVGVNWGSVPDKIKKSFDNKINAILSLAEEEIELLESCGFSNIVVSLKSHDVLLTVESNIAFREKHNYPLHLGITEAGLPGEGSIRSAVGLGILLNKNIGETIRVSLSGDPVNEIPVCKTILESLGIRSFKGLKIVSCPTCARTRINVEQLARELKEKLSGIEKNITIAVMGCEVNGPGEAKDADLGIAGAKDYGFIFSKGQFLKKVEKEKLLDTFIDLVKETTESQ